MRKVEIAEKGKNLAKVLWYYNLIDNTNSSTQKLVCPFHSDLRPSMQANFLEGYYYCHGCGATGDAQDFVKNMEKDLGDLQKIRKYYDILKSKKCSDINPKFKMVSKKMSRELYNQAYDYFHGLSRINWVDDDSIEVKEARDYMEKRGFFSNTLIKCNAKVTYNKSYGLVFPMLDNGKFKGWVCRTMVPRIEEERKYLYNEGFSRVNSLIGSYGTKKYVFVVEGYMDQLKFVQYDEDNVVAILGWKMSTNQIQKLKDQGITDVISALDNDECGKKGTEYLKNYFNVTRFCYLKGVKDPGDMEEKNFRKMHKRTMKIYNGG